MNHLRTILILLALGSLLVVDSADARIAKVAKRMGFVELHGAYAIPQGTVNGYPVEFGDFVRNGRLVDVDAEDLYGSTGSFGLRFGQMRGGFTQMSIGFQYTKLGYNDDPSWTISPEYQFASFDLDLDLNLRMVNFRTSDISPFVGIGAASGLVRAHTAGVSSEYALSFLLAVNFGVEWKLWQNSTGSNAVSLSSVNSYQFLATGDRPRYVTIGAAVRYYAAP